MSVSKARREELRRQFRDVGGFIGQVCPQGGPTVDELRALLDLADERDRYRAKLEEARRSYLKDGTIFAREVDAALEGKHEHQ